MSAAVVDIRPGCRTLEAGRGGGKTALAWLWLQERAKESGGSVECLRCRTDYTGCRPPALGRCGCSSYFFGVRIPEQSRLEF